MARAWARCIGVQAVVGGVVLSALAHPVFFALVAAEAAAQALLAPPQALLGLHLWLLGLFNVAVGYAAAMTLATLAARRRGFRLTGQALFMPIYWLTISLAAYRALWQFAWAPFRWEKTRHGVSRMSNGHGNGRGGAQRSARRASGDVSTWR